MYQIARDAWLSRLRWAADLRIEDQRLLDQDVFAPRQEVLHQAKLHVIGHGQDRGVVPIVRTLLGLGEVGRRIERIDGGHAAVPEDPAALAADVAEADQQIPHSKWARFSSRWSFSSTSSGVICRFPWCSQASAADTEPRTDAITMSPVAASESAA